MEGGDSGRIRPTGETPSEQSEGGGSPRALPNASACNGNEWGKEDSLFVSKESAATENQFLLTFWTAPFPIYL
ncbi:hypothetical protein SporoP8_03660 [Sporosarcina ureae]|nr:hypothetical protein SporoP8_03660 [Sporosarcina ureae]